MSTDYIKPDLTRRENYPIFGDTVTFTNGQGSQKEIFTGVISEHNVGGPAVWDILVDGNKMFVHGDEILHIERTGEVSECPTMKEYDPKTDPDLQDLS